MKKTAVCLSLFFVFLCSAFADKPAPNSNANAAKVIQLGVVESTLYYFPKKIRSAILIPVGSLVGNVTGVTCKPKAIADPMEIGRLLESGRLDVAVLNGFEFAWVQEKYPKVKPLAITVVGRREWPEACLVTLEKSPIVSLSDLNGKSLSLPKGSRPHVRFFLQRECTKWKECPFTICRHPTIVEALDDVVREKIAGVVVDAAAFDKYRLVKPGCHRRLHIAQKSVRFPAGVLAYREGNLSLETVARFRKGLLAAHEDTKNQILMSLWRLSSFGEVPEGYLESLRRIRKLYPRE